jgi:hypothetical protein
MRWATGIPSPIFLSVTALRNPKFGGTTLYRLYDYLYIVSQSNEKAHEALHRIASELACQHRRHLGLIDTHKLGPRLPGSNAAAG